MPHLIASVESRRRGYRAASPPDFPPDTLKNWEKKMSKTVYTYITRGDAVLYALADNDFGNHDAPRHAPHYVDKKLTDWERDAKIAFGEYVASAQLGGDWEYAGSSRWSAADPEVGMTVAVYESPVPDFAGDQLEALVEHPWTVFRGYVEFVDQSQRYAAALLDLDDIAKVSSDPADIERAVGDVLSRDREHYDTCADIADLLRFRGWYYFFEDGEALRRPEAA